MAPTRSRVRRLVRWSLYGLALVVVLVAAAVTMVVRSLDRPWLKGRLQALVAREGGVEVDWSSTQVRALSGLELRDLVVRSPGRMRGRAPELLRVGALEVTWTPDSLMGHGTTLTSVTAHGVELTVVRDEEGRTSFSELGPAAPPNAPVAKAPAPSSPLSHLLADLLRAAPPLGRVDVDGISLKLLLYAQGEPEARVFVDGLALHGAFSRGDGGWRLAAQLGEPAAPLQLNIDRQLRGQPDGRARATVAAQATATREKATLQLDAEVLEQTLLRQTPVKKLVHLEAEARFDPKLGRVVVQLARSTLADGAATVEAELEVPDVGPLVVRKADGRVDGVHLQRLAPDGTVPARFERAELAYHVEGLLLDRTPRLLPSGAVSLEGDVGGVRAGTLSAGDGRIELSARPDRDGGMHVQAKLRVGSLGLPGIAARDGRLTVEARELHVDREAPLETRGQLSLDGQLGSLELQQKKTHLSLGGARFTLGARLHGAAPYNIDAEIPVERSRLVEGARVLYEGPARIELHASELLPDALHPPRSRGKVHLTATLGPARIDLTADKHADSVDYQVTAQSPTLALLRPFLPAEPPWDLPWEKMGASLSSAGRVEQLFSPLVRVRHHTEAHFDRPSFGGVSAREATLVASSDGSARKIAGELELRLGGGAMGAVKLGDEKLGLKFAADVSAPSPSLSVKLSTESAVGPGGALDAELSFERKTRALRYHVDGKAAGLSALAPLLAKSGLGRDELAQLSLALSGQGTVAGLVADVDKDGRPRLVGDPLATLLVLGTLELRAQNLAWAKGDRELSVPKALWQLGFTGDVAHRTLHSHLELDALHFAAGDNEYNARGVVDDIESTLTGDLRLGVGSVDHKLQVVALEQDVQPGYTVGDLTLTLKGSRDQEGVIHIPELRFDNRAAGTELVLKGGIDVGGERRSLTFRGELKQDLAKLWAEPKELQARGGAAVTLRIASGNLRLFHATAAVRVSGADLKLPRRNISVESADGEIPISADLLLEKGQLGFVRDTSVNTYSELRYSDQHPLFHDQSFITVKRISTPLVTVAPLEGSLRIEHNVISLSQFDTGLRQGRVTGQCIVDWRKDDAVVHLHLRASHVLSESGEPFDGNAAVVLSLKDRSVEGRAQILRIGRRHLLDLLDLQDPHHADPAMNRIRRALALGYPDQVRLTFSHGFANARVTLGGLARLITIGELRGIPMGPLIDKVLAPLEDQEDEQ